MKILVVADEECSSLWDYYTPGKLKEYDLILSGGDLKADYLSFLVTVARAPLLYIHGNHDGNYKDRPPEGCDCIDDKLIVYKGLRILGLGGCYRYSNGSHQYTESQMRKRIRKLKWAIRQAGGVDIVLTHAAPFGVGDAADLAHRGFESFLELIDTYHPKLVLHGHLHLNYETGKTRLGEYHGTQVINCWERYVLDWDDSQKTTVADGFWQRITRLFSKSFEIMNF